MDRISTPESRERKENFVSNTMGDLPSGVDGLFEEDGAIFEMDDDLRLPADTKGVSPGFGLLLPARFASELAVGE